MSKRTKIDYRKIWEEYNNKTIPSGYHIHHIDGDSHNNSPENLLCVSPEEHWKMHYEQGDIIAKNGIFIQGASGAGKLGGAAGKGKTISEEQRLKMSISIKKAYSKKGSWNKGRKRSKETKEKISAATAGSNNPRYNKPVSEETRLKISKTKKRKFETGELTPHKTNHSKESREKISEKRKEFYDNGGVSAFSNIYDVLDESGNVVITNVLKRDLIESMKITERQFLSLYAHSRRTGKTHPKHKIKIISKGKYNDT
jgi:hypothetical protein